MSENESRYRYVDNSTLVQIVLNEAQGLTHDERVFALCRIGVHDLSQEERSKLLQLADEKVVLR